MSFYSDASLVLIPSGYKDQKIYSAKPTDGSGDMVFSRASNATRVASNGLIEKVRTNLVTYSEAFDNAAWTKAGVGTYTSAVTTGFTDPTGGTNAQRWLATIATTSDRAFVRQLLTLTNGIPYNVSFWIKSNTASAQELYVQFQGGAVATVTATTSWTRVSHTQTTSVTSVFVGVDAKELATDVLIYGYQVEVGDIATDYIATTSAAVSVGPVSGLPRLDYLNSSCPRLLLEPQRTNLVTYSEQFNNAAWNNTLYPVTITANQTASPSGYLDADLITPTAALSRHAVGESASGTAGSVYTASAFFKKSGARYVVLTDGGDAVWHIVTADLDTATITNQTNATGTIINYGNGWYRVSCTFTRTNTGNIDVFLGASNTASATFLPSFNDVTLTTFAWGAQVEAGAYATSYIPTLGTSVTRVADDASKTGISSLIGQTEGTLFVDINYNGNKDSSGSVALRVYTGTNEAYIFITNANLLQCELYNATQQCAIVGSIGSNGRKKIAFAYKQNDFVVYMNGVQIGTDTSGTVGAMANVNVGSYDSPNYITLNGINQALLFKTRLTNAQMQELTSL